VGGGVEEDEEHGRGIITKSLEALLSPVSRKDVLASCLEIELTPRGLTAQVRVDWKVVTAHELLSVRLTIASDGVGWAEPFRRAGFEPAFSTQGVGIWGASNRRQLTAP